MLLRCYETPPGSHSSCSAPSRCIWQVISVPCYSRPRTAMAVRWFLAQQQELRLRPRRGDLKANQASWSPKPQQNVADHTIRRFCDSTGFTLNTPLEPTHFHKNLRNTVIDLAICKGRTIIDITSIPGDDDEFGGPQGLHYSTEGKVNLFADPLESSFQENPEPYDDDFIEHVEEKVERYMDRNVRRHTAPLSSPQEVMDIILNLNNKKAPGKDGIKNIALKAFSLNAITYVTKILIEDFSSTISQTNNNNTNNSTTKAKKRCQISRKLSTN
ncbi:uncharacterized protein TNIN_452901 [Trichonephila inaurata madagascariensis]|uniref:Uncharacterized protein n=1 Tax=Trichonephila inaurata madagascariensis TaxID=2747483 RepID=A0A8X7CRT1_9ARAC|nr:uncharacterized protein TNIN_452901 [Trichonephila inaurata madagascariensis]